MIFEREKLDTFHVVPNCYRTPVIKVPFVMLLFGLAQSLCKFWLLPYTVKWAIIKKKYISKGWTWSRINYKFLSLFVCLFVWGLKIFFWFLNFEFSFSWVFIDVKERNFQKKVPCDFLKIKTFTRMRRAHTRQNWPIFWNWTHKNKPDLQQCVQFRTP